MAGVSQAKRARSPRARQLGGQSCEDVSGETGRTTSRAVPRNPDWAGLRPLPPIRGGSGSGVFYTSLSPGTEKRRK
eukprot:2458894-Pyramimonas_sp.AAC.1